MTVKKTSILYAEDEVIIAEKVCNVLESKGYDVEIGFDGEEAFRKYKQRDFDLVITDLKMPVMDGIELIREIRRTNPGQRIIVATAFPAQLMPWNTRFSPSQSLDEKFDFGSIEYLIKPFSARNLLKLVEKTLTEEKPAFTKGSRHLDVLKGSAGLTCRDLILMYALRSESIIIEVRKESEIGRIYLEEGEVIHALSVTSEGEDAFFEIISWEADEFTTIPYKEVSHSIKRGVGELLFEGSKM